MSGRTLRSKNKEGENEQKSTAAKVKLEKRSKVKEESRAESKKMKLTAEIKVTKESKSSIKKEVVELNSNKPLKMESGGEVLKPKYPIPARLKCNIYLGFHASVAGGLWKSIVEAQGCRALSFACFLRSQRTWKCKVMEETSVEDFKKKLNESWISSSMILPHGSYLLNCGSSDPEILEKSRGGLVDEVTRCQRLGIGLYNFHPGSAKNGTVEKSIELIAESINIAHQQTSSVVILIENMSCQGNTVGGKFEELKEIIDKVHDQSRIGVCFDTCHAFAAGYDLRSEKGYEDTKKQFNEIIGKKYLKAVHLNDSKGPLGCHLDRHENIGRGKLGMGFFKRFMNDSYFTHIPVVLETPECDYGEEIDLLYSFVGK